MSVHSVHLSSTHSFSKDTVPFINLIADHGVEGDAHAGKTVKHLYNLRKHERDVAKAQRGRSNATLPVPPNLKQVHLIQSELFDEDDFVGTDGVKVEAGQLGENITIKGVDILGLSEGTRLYLVDPDKETLRAQTLGAQAGQRSGRYSWKSKPGAAVPFTTNHPTVKPIATDLTDLLLLLTIVVSALFLLLRHFPLTTLILLLSILALYDFLCSRPWRRWYSENAESRATLESESYSVHDAPTIRITGLRNPCGKIDDFKQGLLAKSYVRDGLGKVIGARVGVMGTVERGGIVRAGMSIVVEEPEVKVAMQRI